MVTAEDVLAAVRVHGDRVHDAVRRVGCAPAAAVQVVETSALDLVDALVSRPDSVGDLVGWWFARARTLGRSAADSAEAGAVQGDANQRRLAAALEARPERQRAALLLRDAYDLPAASVGGVLGVDADGAMAAVGQARLALLPSLVDGPVASLGAHPADVAALARLAEGGPVATRDATTRRHVQSCEVCSAVVHDQERARRLLLGLSIMALPAGERAALLARVEPYARDALVTAGPLLVATAEVDEPARRRGLSAPLLALGVVLAVVLGLASGLYLSRSRQGAAPSASTSAVLPSLTGGPVRTLPVAPTTAVGRPTTSSLPTTNVFTISPTPAPTVAPTPRPVTTTAPPVTVVAEPLSLQLDPAAGPAGTVVQVVGRGWSPGANVSIVYRDPLGRATGAGAQVAVDARGRFTTPLATDDPANLPGRHTIVAQDGAHSAEATFTASG